jgi:para-nitrobenzyl esterase
MRRRAWLVMFASLISCRVALGKPLLLDTGALEGAKEGAVFTYKGVPFAGAPIEGLRWREPQPVKPWNGVRKVTRFAPACMQDTVSMPGERPPAVSEDCLYLNIWTPTNRDGARLPVFVWIYGGGYSSGSASMPLYWGDRLALRGMVVVTVACISACD